MILPAALLVPAVLALLAISAPAARAVPTGPSGAQLAPAETRSPLEQLLVAGHEALSRNELMRAAGAFEQAAKLDPKSARAYLGLAEVAHRQNLPNIAEDWIRKAVAADPKNPEAVRALGRFQFTQARFADAEASFRRGVALAPSVAAAHIDLGENYLNGLKRPRDAEAAYREAIRLKPDHAGGHLGLGAALAAQGRIPEAVAEYELAAKLESASPLPMHLLARLYASQRRMAEALAALDRALQASPGYVPALLDRGDLRLAGNEPEKAVADYRAALQAMPRLAQAQFKIGMVHQMQRRWRDAEQAYLAAVELDPQMFGAYNNLAWMAAERRERLGDALNWIRRAIEIAPQVLTLHDTLGWVHRARGEKDQAISALETAAASAPPRADFHYHLGIAYGEAGKKSEAVTALRRALEINAQFPEAADARRQLEKLVAK